MKYDQKLPVIVYGHSSVLNYKMKNENNSGHQILDHFDKEIHCWEVPHKEDYHCLLV